MRGKQAPRRKIDPDPKYRSVVLAKLINVIMQRGKKTVARGIVYGALDFLKQKSEGKDPLELFDLALKNVGPQVEVKGRRVGGANYRVPVPVGNERRVALAYRWLVQAAQEKKGKPMDQKLGEELLLATQGEGGAMKRKLEMQRTAEANRAFAHFA